MKRILILALPLLTVLALTIWRAQGPVPLTASAPAEDFSAARASVVLQALLAEGVAHPIGSPANQRVRERVEQQFRALGYETSIQSRFACNSSGVCGPVENILARRNEDRDRDVVLMLAHYDSVPAAPGASDDGMGVAALLEVARAIRSQQFRNDVMFLITDGEEAGLLGAEGFVADQELLRRIAVVVNVENRGTKGPSTLFETSRGNHWLIRNIAPNLARPRASSLYYEIYNLLPNDTDLTVFKRAGKAGINFAAIGAPNRYHTPNDNLNHASLRTLQHHGENLLGTLRGLASADLAARSGGDAVYFDVLGSFMLRWPEKWTIWIALISLAILVWGSRPSRLRPEQRTGEAGSHRATLQPLSIGVLATFSAILTTALLGFGLAWVARIGGEGATWSASPLPAVAAMWLTGIASSMLVASLFIARAGGAGLLFGAAIVWHMIAIALALTIPGASYLFLVPAVVVTAAAAVRMTTTAAAATAATVAATVVFPLAVSLYEALGNGALAAIALLIGTAMTLAFPLITDRRSGLTALALAIVCAVIALMLRPYTAEHPRHVSLAWIDDQAYASPRWTTTTLTPALEAAATFERSDPALTPWSRSSAWSAQAPAGGLPRVEMSSERSAAGVTITVRSQREANRLVLLLRGGTVVRVNGTPLPPASARRSRAWLRDGWAVAAALATREMQVEIEATGPVEAVASDISFGLPSGSEALARARDASPAVPAHDGDLTITRTRATFGTPN